MTILTGFNRTNVFFIVCALVTIIMAIASVALFILFVCTLCWDCHTVKGDDTGGRTGSTRVAPVPDP
jgi:hypothetical protein